MKVLVTGATGFIGCHVVSELLKRKIPVVVTSRNMEKAKTFDWFSSVEYIAHTIGSPEIQLFQKFGCPDLLIHLAWEDLGNFKHLVHFEQHLFNHCRFLRQLLDAGLKSLTVTGTCLEYGIVNGELSESLPPQPVTSYGLAKNSLRCFLELLQNENDFSLKWVRLFYLYGKGQSRKSLIAQLEEALFRGDKDFPMSGGEQLRDYLPVAHVAKNIVDVALQSRVQGVINCCSGQPVSIRRFVEDYLAGKEATIHLKLGSFPYPDYEPMAFWGDTTRLFAALGDKQ